MHVIDKWLIILGSDYLIVTMYLIDCLKSIEPYCSINLVEGIRSGNLSRHRSLDFLSNRRLNYGLCIKLQSASLTLFGIAIDLQKAAARIRNSCAKEGARMPPNSLRPLSCGLSEPDKGSKVYSTECSNLRNAIAKSITTCFRWRSRFTVSNKRNLLWKIVPNFAELWSHFLVLVIWYDVD